MTIVRFNHIDLRQSEAALRIKRTMRNHIQRSAAGYAIRVSIAKLLSRVKSLAIDIRFGAPLFGIKKTHTIGHTWTVNTDYSVLPSIFANQISRQDVIVDVGCGRGRLVNWLLLAGYKNKVIGIEYDSATGKRLARRTRRFTNVQIIIGDALTNLPSTATLLYLFNPFGHQLMEEFRDKLEAQFCDGRNLRILYYRPLELDVFMGNPAWEVCKYEIPGRYLDITFDEKPTHRQFAVIKRSYPRLALRASRCTDMAPSDNSPDPRLSR